MMGILDQYLQPQMGGLLGGFDDPENIGLLSAGLSMLANSGPSTTPHSFGQIFGSGGMTGLGAYGTAKKGLLDQQKEQMQMDLLKQQVTQATRKNNMVTDWMGQLMKLDNAPSQALSDGFAAGSVGPTVANATRLEGIQKSNPLFGIPRQALMADLATNDGKNISEWMFKRGTPNMKVSNGYAYDENQLKPGFQPQLNVSQNGQTSMVTIGADGMPIVSAPQGASNTYGSYKDVEEKAKANYDLLPLDYADKSGRPFGGSKGQYIKSQQTPPDFPSISPTAQRSADAEALYYAKQDIDNATTPEARRQAEQVYQQMTQRYNAGQSVMTGSGLQSIPEREAQKESLKATQEQARKDTRQYGKITAAIPMARTLLQTATGSGVGALTDATLGFFGHSTQSADAANQLETLAGWMTANVPRMEGPQSDKDTMQYQQMAAMIGDRTKPVSQRLAALNTLETIQNKYAVLNNLQGSGDSSQPKTFNDFGYSSPQQAIQDARNAMLKNPAAKSEIIRRLEAAGINNHGLR